MPKPQQRQQFGLRDMQMLQQNFMRNQELRKHEKFPGFPGFWDGRQQSNANQLPLSNRNASMTQYFPAINGTHLRDVSQMLSHGSMNLVHGFPNGFMQTEQVRDQNPRLMDSALQQFDPTSLLGSPVDNMMYTFNQPTHFQGRLSHDVANVMTVGTPTMQSDFNNSFSANHFNVYSDQIPDCGVLGNSEHMNPLVRNLSFSQFNERQEQSACPSLFPGKTVEYVPPQRPASLDPLEQKIFINTEDTNWNASYGTGNAVEQSDGMNCLSSRQTGSWSALMQSAVAEASSCDNNGMQEEWSGLSFQNTEVSTENELSGFVDGGKQKICWADIGMQNPPTPTSEQDFVFNDSVENNTFPGFQSSNTSFSVVNSDSSFGYDQKFFKTVDKPSKENTQSSFLENDPFSYSVGGLDDAHADLNNRGSIEAEDSLLKSSGVANLSMVKSEYMTSQQLIGSRRLDKLENVNTSVNNYQNESLSWNPPPLGNSLNLLPGPCGQAGETCQRQRNGYQNDNLGYNYPSRNITRENKGIENVWSHNRCNSQPVSCKTSFQEGLSGHEKILTGMETLPSEKAVGVLDPHITAQTRRGMVDHVQQVSCSRSQTSLSKFGFTGLEDRASAAYRGDIPQNFGLRSAPPSQLQTSSNSLFPSHSSLQMGNSTNSQAFASLYPKSSPSAHFTCGTPRDTSVAVSNTTPINKPFQILESEPTNPPYSNFPRSNNFEILAGHPIEQGVNCAFTTRNLEPFGTQNYSMLPQMQFLQNSDTGPSKRCHAKNPKADSYTNTEVHNSTHLQPELSFFPPARRHDSLQMISRHEQTGPQILSNSNIMDQTEDPQISLHKASSWSEHYYSNLRNGNILPANAVPLLKPASALSIHDGSQTSMLARSRKRKISTSTLLPWDKDVEQGSLELQNMSMAQLEWTLASNRLHEKVEVDGETTNEQVQEQHRSKKRLILTSQLMQQVFRPAKASIMSSDLSSKHDSMVYLAAKVALGDDDASEMKNKSPKRNKKVMLSRDVENFEKRAKKLESDLLRMEKRSFTDIKLELEELEKYFVINRFARFHFRGEQSDSSLQRYMVGHPIFREVPDVAHCLSL
ncbi:uncharacterized protein LOC124914350 [Impatiens glandulifera]|uniref:uncharacterized protein LOC124914350 n=1 Tax=Impatiens glandulifera TaxID=253017 RepID=UPI001FB06F21|nr:uncharacterized protein LOC124914350 [Impatiens glandulifera]